MDNGSQDFISADAFRHGMRHVPTVVTIVTMGDDEGVQGVTIGSFVSLSMDPPLVCFNVQKSISIHDRIVEAKGFAIHVLREKQSIVSDWFARSDVKAGEQFEAYDYEISETGAPLLKDCLVRFECESYRILPGGDHSILVGKVISIMEGNSGRPIVYHQRAYHGVGEHIADHEHKSRAAAGK